jgi:hypothetical protein
MANDLFDIEYWLPFHGGEYHCTIAVGVTQEYVDKVKAQYEIELQNWRTTPSAWKLPFFHSLKIVKHKFMASDKSFIKTDKHNELIEKAKEEGRKEGKEEAMKSAKYYITNQAKLAEFKKQWETKLVQG